MLINHNIIINKLKEDNLTVIVDDDKVGSIWTKRYQSHFLYSKPDEDLLYYLNSQPPKNNDKCCTNNSICKLVVFDNCLTKEFIEKTNFIGFLRNADNNRIRIIIMTQNPNVICCILKIFNRTFLHSLIVDWSKGVDNDIIKTYPVLKDQKTIENIIIQCIRSDTCIVLNKRTPTLIESF